MYFAKASRKVSGSIGEKRVGNGGGSEEDNSGDAMAEEESNTIIGAISEVEVRWTEMSMMGGDEIGSVKEVGGGGVAMVAVVAEAEVVGGDLDYSSSSSPLCWESSVVMGISLTNPPIFFSFFEDFPSAAFRVYTLCLGWRLGASFLFFNLVVGGDFGASSVGEKATPLSVSLLISSLSLP